MKKTILFRIKRRKMINLQIIKVYGLKKKRKSKRMKAPKTTSKNNQCLNKTKIGAQSCQIIIQQ